jgi:Na+/H+-dicarboxylate symporter
MKKTNIISMMNLKQIVIQIIIGLLTGVLSGVVLHYFGI